MKRLLLILVIFVPQLTAAIAPVAAQTFVLNPYSVVSGDVEAAAFITAAGITDPTQQTAINNFVASLKTANIWTKMLAVYPFVGGTATSHKFNLKDPRDLDAAFRLVYVGTGNTHSAAGFFAANGGYADTKFVPLTNLASNTFTFGLKLTGNPDLTAKDMMGASGTPVDSWFFLNYQTTNFNASISGNNATSTVTPNANLISGSTNGTNIRAWVGGTQDGSSSWSGSRTSFSVYLGKRNASGSVNGTASMTFQFAYIAQPELTSSEMAALNTAVVNLQTALGR